MSAIQQRLRIAVKAVIIEDGKLLCISYRDQYGPWFTMPGGGQRHGETLEAAVRRECLEEAGIEVDVGPLLWTRDYVVALYHDSHGNPEEHQIELFFRCTRAPGSEPRHGDLPDNDQTGVCWKPLTEMGRGGPTEGDRVFPLAIARELRERGLPERSHHLGVVR
ncbi:MAG: NUDIX domain-containing protein [Planctomycetota bacterium]|jgi:ADP-ribose pyrophosphatase YjhB (NUDIX family)